MSELAGIKPVPTFDHASLNTAKSDRLEAERTLRAVQYLNRTEFSNRNQSGANYLKFSYDSATRRSVVKVVDHATGDILYQIPPEEVLKLAADLRRRERLGSATQEPGGDTLA